MTRRENDSYLEPLVTLPLSLNIFMFFSRCAGGAPPDAVEGTGWDDQRERLCKARVWGHEKAEIGRVYGRLQHYHQQAQGDVPGENYGCGF